MTKETIIETDPGFIEDRDFGWVPAWLMNPAPPTPALLRGLEQFRKLYPAEPSNDG